MEFDPTIPAFERAKLFHALDCAATVICSGHVLIAEISSRIVEPSRCDTKESVSQWFSVSKAKMTINKIQSGI